MASNVLNAYVGTTPMDAGVLYRAPIGTELPKDATSKLDGVWEDHGAVGEDGLNVTQDRSTNDIKQLGGDTFLTLQDNYDEQVELALLEDDNDAVIRTAFGDANYEKTTSSEGGTDRVIYHTSQPLPISSFVLQTVYGDKKKRYVIERGQVVSIGETKDVHSDVTRKTLTIKTYKPAALELKGGNVVEYRHDPNAAKADDSTPTPPAGTGGNQGGATEG